jgi:hypothetical protein
VLGACHQFQHKRINAVDEVRGSVGVGQQERSRVASVRRDLAHRRQEFVHPWGG